MLMSIKKLVRYPAGKDLIFGIVIMALMVAIFIYAYSIPFTSASGVVDSGFFPSIRAQSI